MILSDALILPIAVSNTASDDVTNKVTLEHDTNKPINLCPKKFTVSVLFYGSGRRSPCSTSM